MNIWNILVTQILYRPVFNVLIVFLALFWWRLWIAIVLLTLLVRWLMYKSSAASNNMQQGMSNIQPKIEELQKKYADDPQKLSEETMKVFKNEWKWPFKGCITMLIQIPVFIWLYRVILAISQMWTWDIEIINMTHGWLYSFFYSFWEKYIDIQNIKSNFLWINLYDKGNWILTIIVTALYYLQMQLTQLTQNKKAMPKVPGATMPDMSKMMSGMNIWMSLMMWLMVFGLNSAVGLYLLTSCLFSICQYCRRYRAILKAKWNEKFHKNEPTIIQPK